MSEMISSAAPRPRRRPGGPPRWSAADKAAYLTAFATSRLTIRAFCQERGVPRATFTLWQREAREAQKARKAREVQATRDARPRRNTPAFAAVELVPAPGASGSTPGRAPGITMVMRGPAGLESELTGLDAATAVTLVRVVIAATGIVPRRR